MVLLKACWAPSVMLRRETLRVQFATTTRGPLDTNPPHRAWEPDLLTEHAQPVLRTPARSQADRLHTGTEQALCSRLPGPTSQLLPLPALGPQASGLSPSVITYKEIMILPTSVGCDDH